MFAIHKPTNRKFYFPGTLPSGAADPASKIPVADLPSHPTLYGTEVKCDACSTWHKAATMHATPAGPGLTCAACSRAQQPTEAQSETDTQEKALRKARALLRLATSSNPEEAAAAAAKAAEIIDRYRLNIAAMQDEGTAAPSEEPIDDFSRDPLNAKDAKLDRWKLHLAQCLAELNQCFLYVTAGKIALVGTASDVATVRFFYGHLETELERLAARHCRGCGRIYWNNFRLGAAETVISRLKQQRAATVQQVRTEAAGTGRENALALVNQSLAIMEQRTALAKSWAYARHNFRSRSMGAGGRFDSGARAAGRAAGHSVNLNSASRSLSSGSRHALH